MCKNIGRRKRGKNVHAHRRADRPRELHISQKKREKKFQLGSEK